MKLKKKNFIVLKMIKSLPNNKFWKNKRVFLTGHTSFKGTWLKMWLENLGAKVKGYSVNYPSYPISLHKVIYKKKIKSEDILNYNYLKKKILEFKPDIVFHMAAQTILSEAKKNPIDNYKTNIIGTASVLESCALSKSVKLVSIVTTDKCYEENKKLRYYKENSKLGGSEPYSSSKACAEIISKSYIYRFKELNKKIVTLRGGNVIGGGDWKKNRLVPDIIKSIKSNSNLILRKPKSTRPWQHVLDCLNGYLIASEHGFKMKKTFNTWNFSPPLKNQIKVINLVNYMIKSFNYSKKKIRYKKLKLYESQDLHLSSTKANKEIKWKTIMNQKDVIEYIVKWYDSYFQKKNMKIFCLNQINSFYKLARGKNL
jgi:CDP-glucose 4,6-dehydratase